MKTRNINLFRFDYMPTSTKTVAKTFPLNTQTFPLYILKNYIRLKVFLINSIIYIYIYLEHEILKTFLLYIFKNYKVFIII